MTVASKSVAIITGASMGFGRAFAEEWPATSGTS